MGFALFGSYNEHRKSDNPFDERFNDNYVKGEGNTEKEAVADLCREVNSTANSLWEF